MLSNFNSNDYFVSRLINFTHKNVCESKFPDEGPAGQKQVTTQYWVSFTPTCVYLHILILQLIVYILRNMPQRFKFTGLLHCVVKHFWYICSLGSPASVTDGS